MAKSATVFECQQCGAQFPKWAGQCSECGTWNTLIEVTNFSIGKKTVAAAPASLVPITEVEARAIERIPTGIGELDRVLGGGLVPGEVVLMVGEPGIGKSTILTQLSLLMGRVVYVCGEESPGQVKLRIDRLGKQSKASNLEMLPETNIERILTTLHKHDLSLLIVDSVQTLYSSSVAGLAGSISQIRECTGQLIAYAKRRNVPVVLVGHVTKEGEMAGPKVLEHMVDAVLELSGDRYYDLRLLRTQKNRFGATDEVGVFQMVESGLIEVKNPSEFFLSEREAAAVGSAVAVVMEGTRPVLLEVQALVVDSELPVPRRVSQGVDVRRVQILLGVLSKYTRLPVATKDVFVKVTGGLSVKEPAVDLAIALAVASSTLGKPLPKQSVAIGEVGLLGEIRSVSWIEKRNKEAAKLGYTKVYSRDSYRKVSDIIKTL